MGYSTAEQSSLLQVAYASIAAGLQTGKPLSVNTAGYPAPLTENRASFVTLTQDGLLRGCIGSLEACRALVEDVARNAFAAAFRDPRFPPLQQQEFDALDIHVSVLGTPEPVACASERDWPWFWANVGGLFVRHPKFQKFDIKVIDKSHSSTNFLPDVWKWEDECYYLNNLNSLL